MLGFLLDLLGFFLVLFVVFLSLYPGTTIYLNMDHNMGPISDPNMDPILDPNSGRFLGPNFSPDKFRSKYGSKYGPHHGPAPNVGLSKSLSIGLNNVQIWA